MRSATGSCADAWAQQLLRGAGHGDGVDGMRDDRVGARPGGQPGVLGTSDEQEDWWAAIHLVLELPSDPHSPRRNGLAVEDHQVVAVGVNQGLESRGRGHLRVLQFWQVRGGSATQRHTHLLPDQTVVAVDEDLGGGSIGHDLTVARGPRADRVTNAMLIREGARGENIPKI